MDAARQVYQLLSPRGGEASRNHARAACRSLEGSAWATLGVSEQVDCFGDAVVLPRLLTCASLAVTWERVVDGGHRVVRGVPRMPAHMGGSGRLPGGASSGTGCRVGGAAGAILQELAASGEIRVTDLQARVGGSQANVSGHLACLKDCGLVADRPQGRQSFYRLKAPEVVGLLRAAEALLARNGEQVALCPNYRAES